MLNRIRMAASPSQQPAQVLRKPTCSFQAAMRACAASAWRQTAPSAASSSAVVRMAAAVASSSEVQSNSLASDSRRECSARMAAKSAVVCGWQVQVYRLLRQAACKLVHSSTTLRLQHCA